jgi:hypothetical protein
MKFQYYPFLAIALSCLAIVSATSSKLRDGKRDHHHAKKHSSEQKGKVSHKKHIEKLYGSKRHDAMAKKIASELEDNSKEETELASSVFKMMENEFNLENFMVPIEKTSFNGAKLKKFNSKDFVSTSTAGQSAVAMTTVDDDDNDDNNWFLNFDTYNSHCGGILTRRSYRLEYCVKGMTFAGGSFKYFVGAVIPSDDDTTEYYVLGQDRYSSNDCSGTSTSSMVSRLAAPPTCGSDLFWNPDFTDDDNGDDDDYAADGSNYYYGPYINDDDGGDSPSLYADLYLSASVTRNATGYPESYGFIVR